MRGARTAVCGFLLGSLLHPSDALAGAETQNLTLDVAGHISPVCSIALPERHHVGELSRAGETSIPFTLDCNQSLSFALRSEEGGLRHESVADYFVPYRARLELLDDAAGVGRNIESEDMRAASEIDRLGDAAPFDETGRLVIHWDDPAQTLAQGTYRDVVTITLVLDGP